MEPVLRYFEGQIGLGALALLLILGIVAWVTWKLAAVYTKKTNKVDNLPCEKHEKVIDSLSESIQGINVTLAKLETGQADIYRMMSLMASSSSTSQFTQSNSPISLTEKGKEIAALLGFDSMIQNNWSIIESIIEDEKNPYDIQMEFISQFIANPEKYLDVTSIDKIKNDAYQRGVALIEYMRMLGIMARDRYFSLHNIDVSDVDKNDPSKK